MKENICRCKKAKQNVSEFNKIEIFKIERCLKASPELMDFMNMCRALNSEQLQDIIKMMEKNATA